MNYIDQLLEEAPTLTDDKRDKLEALFGGQKM